MDRSPGREGKERSSFVVAVLLLCASAGVLIALATMQSRSKDFMSYYAAGTLARTAPDRLYSLERQQEIELPLTDAPSFLPWVHPAAEALLFAPVSALPYRTAFAVWAVINAGLLATSVWLLRRRLRAMGEGTYAIAAVCGIPILAGFWGGQDHLLTLLLWVLGYLHAEEGRDWDAGVWFGLALIRFQVTLPVLLLFAVLRRWKVLAGAALGAASLLAVSLLLVGRTFVPTYWAALRFLGAHHDSATATYMPNVRGLVACVFGADPHAVLLTAVASAAVLLPALILWSRRGRPFAILFASAVMVAVAIDPHGFLYEWTLLLPSGVLLVERRPEWRWVLLGVGAMEVALLLARHDNLGWLGPVLAACGLAAARSERPVNDNVPVAAG